MDSIIKTIEVGIGISIATIIVGLVMKILATTNFFDYLREIVYNLGDLLGGNFASFLFTALLGIILIMFGRWIISRLGNNGGQNPNSNS